MSRLCLLAAVKQTNQTPYNFLHDENIWVIVFELSVVVGSLVVQLWCSPAPARSATAPCTPQTPYEKTGSNRSQKVGTKRTIDWRNGYPGHHLRLSRSTQSAGRRDLCPPAGSPVRAHVGCRCQSSRGPLTS